MKTIKLRDHMVAEGNSYEIKSVTLDRCLGIFNKKSEIDQTLNPTMIIFHLAPMDDENQFRETTAELVKQIKSISDIDWTDRTKDDVLQDNLDENVIISSFLTEKDRERYRVNWTEEHYIDRYRQRLDDSQRLIIIASSVERTPLPGFLVYSSTLMLTGSGETGGLYKVLRGDDRL